MRGGWVAHLPYGVNVTHVEFRIELAKIIEGEITDHN